LKRRILKRYFAALFLLGIIYWIPFGIISLSSRSSIISSIDQLPDSDAVIIFGTLVKESGEVTPLLKERLEAGRAILNAGKSKTIIVSNTKAAAHVMAKYLLQAGVPPHLIEVDTLADKTPDTCLYEKNTHTSARKVIFVSQGFHLPRLLFQCKKLCVNGTAFPAEALNTDRNDYPLFTKATVRTSRYTREAGLTWLAVLGIY
jgi:SanA protein